MDTPAGSSVPGGSIPVRREKTRRLRIRPARRTVARPRASLRLRPDRSRAGTGSQGASGAATFRAWLDSLPINATNLTGDRIVLMAVAAFGLTHIISGIDFATVQRDLGIAFLVGLAVLLAIGTGVRFAGALTLGFSVLVGFLERIHREPYTGSDVRAATAEAIRVLQDGGNPYAHQYLDTNPPGSPFAYPIGEPVFYWLHQVFFDRIDLADKLSGLMIVLLLAALAPVVGTIRAAVVTMIYGTYGMAANFAMDGSNDTSFAFLMVLALVLLVYSQSRSTPPAWKLALFVLSAVFFGWAILFKQFAWVLYPFVALAIRQRGERWVLHAGVSVGGAILAMLPFFVDSPGGTIRNLSRTGIDNDIWGLNVWSVLKSFAPGLVEPLTSFITLPSVLLTLVVFLVLLPGTNGDLGAAVLRGLLVVGTLLVTAVWTTFPYYTGMSAILAVAIAIHGAPALGPVTARYPTSWSGLLPGWLTRRVRTFSDRIWVGAVPDAARMVWRTDRWRRLPSPPSLGRLFGSPAGPVLAFATGQGRLWPVGGDRDRFPAHPVMEEESGRSLTAIAEDEQETPPGDDGSRHDSDDMSVSGESPDREGLVPSPSADGNGSTGALPELSGGPARNGGIEPSQDPLTEPAPPARTVMRPVLAPRQTWPWRRRLALRTTFPGLLVLLAVCVAAPLRLVGLGDIPSGLNQDEAVSGYDAWSIFQTGRDHHGHPISLTGLESFGDWASPLLTFLTVPVVGVLGLSVESIRLVSALLGIAAVVVGYFLGRELTGSRAIGVGTAWTLALLPVAIHLSRWAIPPTTVPLLVAATLLALVWALRRRSGFGLIVAAAVAGLAMSGYPALKVYIPLLVVATVVIFWRNALAILRGEPGRFLVALGVGGIIAGPILWLGSRDPGGRARAEQVSALNDPSFGPARLTDAYRSYFSPDFLFLRGDGDAMHLPSGFGALPLFLLPLLVAGLVALLFRVFAPQVAGDRERSLVLLAATVLIPLPGALTVPSPHLLRSAQLIPLAAILSAIGLVAVGRLLWQAAGARRRTGSRLGLGILAIAGLLVAGVHLNDQYRNYFATWPDQTATSFQSGGFETAQYAYDHRLEYDTVYVSGMNQGYIYLLFAGPWDPGAVHEELAVNRNPPSFNTVTGIDNVQFSDPPEQVLRQRGETMFQIDRDGEPLFAAIAYTGSTGDRVLVVRPV